MYTTEFLNAVYRFWSIHFGDFAGLTILMDHHGPPQREGDRSSDFIRTGEARPTPFSFSGDVLPPWANSALLQLFFTTMVIEAFGMQPTWICAAI